MLGESNLLTENEALFSRVSYSRLKEIIKNPDVEVAELERTTNTYGEFLFISIMEKENPFPIVFYGFGIHEYRSQYLNDTIHYYSGNLIDEPKRISKAYALKTIEKNHSKWKKIEAREPIEEDTLFSEMADIADEDGAMSMLGMI